MVDNGLPHYGAQKKYVAGQGEAGFIRVSLWVPKDDRKRVINYCRKLRNSAEKRVAADEC